MKIKLKSPLRVLLDALVSLFDGVASTGEAKARHEACRNPSGRVVRFKEGQLVDCTAGPYHRFAGGRIVRVVDHHPVTVLSYGHCSGDSAYYVIDCRLAFPSPSPSSEFVTRYDWELSAHTS